MQNYSLTKPLLITDILDNRNVPNSKTSEIKNGIDLILEKSKSEGKLSTASVYFRDYNTMSDFTINENERYHPASLGKVGAMMAILRQGELNPGFLTKEILIDRLPSQDMARQKKLDFPPEKAIQLGKKYTVKQLLYYMIVESDNNATLWLFNLMQKERYVELFAALQLQNPYEVVDYDANYKYTAAEYSRFLRVLFNATYISNEDADYALSLLSKSEFTDGILKGVPSQILVAHKFGEYGLLDQNGNMLAENEMHESAIIFFPNNAVLLTVMTRGKDKKELASVIAEISKYVYSEETKKPS